MKTIVTIIVGCLLASCGTQHKTVILNNGALIEASVSTDIRYTYGQAVCVRHTRSNGWELSNDGEFKDTTYVINLKWTGEPKTAVITYKIGKIVR